MRLKYAYELSAGRAHACAVVDGSDVWCWGANNHGQLGNGTTTDSTRARVVNGLSGEGDQVVTGADFTCVMFEDLNPGQAVECWGANDHGQLGDGTTVERHRPVRVIGIDGLTEDTSVESIFAGGSSACALMSSGAVRCWGSNDHGQLGDGTTRDRSRPVTVVNLGPGTSLTTGYLSVGASSACAITNEDFAIRCWGANDQGQLGDGTRVDRHTPVAVDFPFDVSAGTVPYGVSVGGKSACATVIHGYMSQTMSASTYCWGDNAHGQLGDGTTKDRSKLTRVLSGAVGTTLGASGPATVPDAPVDLSVTKRSAETLGITWSPPTNIGGSAVTAYVVTWVQAGKAARPADSATVSRSQTQLKVTDLVPGAKYTFSVRAVNGEGRGAVATTSGIVPVRAPAPIVTSDVWKNRVITLTWEGVKTPAHSPVLGYSLSCQVDGGSIFRTKLGPSARSGSVSVTSNKLYSCRVAAMTYAGRGFGSIRVTVGPQKGQGNGR